MFNQNTTPQEKKRYNLYYTKYNILARGYVRYVEVIETTDIYHEIGKKICTTLEHIKRISYTEPKITREECEELWVLAGFEKIADNFWRNTKIERESKLL